MARNEPREEVGGTAPDLRFVGQFGTSNCISSEIAYVYLDMQLLNRMLLFLTVILLTTEFYLGSDIDTLAQ